MRDNQPVTQREFRFDDHCTLLSDIPPEAFADMWDTLRQGIPWSALEEVSEAETLYRKFRTGKTGVLSSLNRADEIGLLLCSVNPVALNLRSLLDDMPFQAVRVSAASALKHQSQGMKTAVGIFA